MNQRVVLAYSGSAADSAAIRRLIDDHHLEVVTLTLDLGARGDLQEIQERGMALGAVRGHVIDVRETFADTYLLPAFQAGALDGRAETLAALARPLIARTLVEIAAIERVAMVAHGAAADSGLDTLIRASGPSLQILGMHAASTPAPPNQPSARPAAVDNGADVEITFDRDVPVAINGVPMSLTELIDSLAVIAAQHGVGAAGDFAGGPALVVLQAAFNARSRDEATSIVRIKLQHGLATAATAVRSELVAPHS
jgi:argininosuccinate synthase